VGRVLYDPYGEVITSTLPSDPVLSGVEGLTDRFFTGARFDGTIGVCDYNGRSRKNVDKAYYGVFDSSLGVVCIASTERGVCKIALPEESQEAFLGWLEAHFDPQNVIEDRGKNEGMLAELESYLAGELREFQSPLDLRGTEFQRKVWREVEAIPYGTTCSYQEIAERIGHPKAYRAVGAANGANPIPIIVPCHRVIGRDGSLRGYGGGLAMKERLLRLEGGIG
jgi:methylated-DNA-[protein]-cysteine S-methyltransferase